jgi:hypothetical protein
VLLKAGADPSVTTPDGVSAYRPALLEYGMPRVEPDHEDPECVLIGGRRKRFSDEVSEVLLDSQATS